MADWLADWLDGVWLASSKLSIPTWKTHQTYLTLKLGEDGRRSIWPATRPTSLLLLNWSRWRRRGILKLDNMALGQAIPQDRGILIWLGFDKQSHCISTCRQCPHRTFHSFRASSSVDRQLYILWTTYPANYDIQRQSIAKPLLERGIDLLLSKTFFFRRFYFTLPTAKQIITLAYSRTNFSSVLFFSLFRCSNPTITILDQSSCFTAHHHHHLLSSPDFDIGAPTSLSYQ